MIKTELIVVLAVMTLLGAVIGYSLAAAKITTPFSSSQVMKMTSGSEADIPR